MRFTINAGIRRRTALAGVGALAAGAATAARRGKRQESGVITVPGESPADTNIPVVGDPRASGGALLALTGTAERRRWYARYAVEAPGGGGIYRLTAVATSPAELPHAEQTGSYLTLSVNDGPPEPIARSQPHWYESAPAWGELARCELGEVELRGGHNALTFTVAEPTALPDGRLGYRFLLDEFTLAPVGPALRAISLGDPATTIGVCRASEAAELRFRLNGRAPTPYRIRYRVLDHGAARVASGTATVPAGRSAAAAPLPDALPPGNYRVLAEDVTGHFAVLPERRAASASRSRFGVNAFTYALVPPARLPAFVSGVRELGVGWVRDGSSWPAAQPETAGPVDTGPFDRVTRTFQDAGLSVLEVLSPPPEWALTETSVPLPADLRHAYHYARRLAAADALQLSNEPDVDTTASTGDQHAAYVKAAALGAGERRTVVLPGIAGRGVFQELMLESEVVRYADAWAFHGYPAPGEEEPDFPAAAEEQRELREEAGASSTPLWMTECGAFFPAEPGVDLTHDRQLAEARYLVLSTVESLATGVQRHFWFCAPPCTDDGVSFALLSRDFQPWPAYSAYAALTALLGEATFVRVLEELLPEAAGFAFDDGAGRTVTVVYAPGRGRVAVPVPGATRVEAYDIMGAPLGPLTPGPDGTVRPRRSRDPFYLVSDAPPPRAPRAATTRRRRLTDADHIVLNQRFGPRHQAPTKDDGDAEPPLGYRLDATTRMELEVYNFTDTDRTVAVTAHAPDGWSIRPAGPAEVTVPAKGLATVPFTITAAPATRPGRDHRLTFRATLDGARVPPSVSLIQRR
ncbi:hypothetical protein [Streptomyces sp. 6N223]|uniref:hypothetical protein n=1 Tax=Streptomyces sp. 6N223 TaxID=3457412 RepID=UPI003FD462D8